MIITMILMIVMIIIIVIVMIVMFDCSIDTSNKIFPETLSHKYH